MFDERDKSIFFCMFLGALFLSAASASRAPQTETAVSVDVAALPAVPSSIGPEGAPAQEAVDPQTVALAEGFYASLMYGYVLEGQVVTRRDFRHDATSAVSPLDLGIVYGELDHGKAAAVMTFSTGSRVIFSRPNPGAALPANWDELVTNNHLIPASAQVQADLAEVQPGDRVRLVGYLVTVTGEDIRPWRSSTRRDDSTIIGGCEIILVRNVQILRDATSA